MTSDPLPLLPARPINSHKGTFGTVLVIGGCSMPQSCMLGAPVLAARAALRSGAGLVRLAMPASLLTEALTLCPSATGIALAESVEHHIIPHEAAAALDDPLDAADALVVGPGLGRYEQIETLLLRLLTHSPCPIVADADALHALANLREIWKQIRVPCILTPHPGEWRSLAGTLSIHGDPADPARRTDAARSLAQKTGCIVVLKGAGTIVTNGHQDWMCKRGSPTLATAGTGDVLAGLIGGLVARCAQKHPPLPARAALTGPARTARDPGRPLSIFEAVCVAVDTHAQCGDEWEALHTSRGGMLADELADLIPAVLTRRTLNQADAE